MASDSEKILLMLKDLDSADPVKFRRLVLRLGKHTEHGEALIDTNELINSLFDHLMEEHAQTKLTNKQLLDELTNLVLLLDDDPPGAVH